MGNLSRIVRNAAVLILSLYLAAAQYTACCQEEEHKELHRNEKQETKLEEKTWEKKENKDKEKNRGILEWLEPEEAYAYASPPVLPVIPVICAESCDFFSWINKPDTTIRTEEQYIKQQKQEAREEWESNLFLSPVLGCYDTAKSVEKGVKERTEFKKEIFNFKIKSSLECGVDHGYEDIAYKAKASRKF